AVGALRSEVLAEAEFLEYGERVGRKNFLRRAAGKKRQHDRDQAAHDMGVAVAAIIDARLAVVSIDAFGQPHLADAALHLVLRRMLLLRQWLQRATEFDDIAVAVIPLVQQLEIVPDFVDRHDGPCPVAITGLYRVPDRQKRWKWNRFLAQI